jgi:hypothetical protein
VATNCFVVPRAIEGIEGVTAIEASVGVVFVPLGWLELPPPQAARNAIVAQTAASANNNCQRRPRAITARVLSPLLSLALSKILPHCRFVARDILTDGLLCLAILRWCVWGT